MLGRLLLALGFAWCVAGEARAAEAPAFDISGQVDLVSDYRFRGVSQTGRDPALQADLTVTHRSGIYANLWSSTIDRTEGGARAELDFGVGYSREIGDAGLDLSATYYTYPGDDDLNYAELSAILTYGAGPFQPRVTFSYIPPQSATRELNRKTDNIYLAAGADFEVPGTPVTVSGEIGYERGYFDYADSGGKIDWQLGATVQLDPVTVAIAYVDSSEHVRDGRSDLAGAGVVARLSLGF